MGGGDKSLLPLNKGSVLREVIERLATQAGPIVLSANGDPARVDGFGLPVGHEAGLGWVRSNCAQSGFAVTVPGDTPFIPADLVARLAEGIGDASMAVAVSEAGLHPVVGLWPVAMVDALADALARVARRASQFVRDQGAAEVSFPPAVIAGTQVDPFFNINTPEDLDYARTLAARQAE